MTTTVAPSPSSGASILSSAAASSRSSSGASSMRIGASALTFAALVGLSLCLSDPSATAYAQCPDDGPLSVSQAGLERDCEPLVMPFTMDMLQLAARRRVQLAYGRAAASAMDAQLAPRGPTRELLNRTSYAHIQSVSANVKTSARGDPSESEGAQRRAQHSLDQVQHLVVWLLDLQNPTEDNATFALKQFEIARKALGDAVDTQLPYKLYMSTTCVLITGHRSEMQQVDVEHPPRSIADRSAETHPGQDCVVDSHRKVT